MLMKKVLLLLPLLVLFSCNKTIVFTKTFNDFEDNRWPKSDVKSYDFKVKKDIESADVTLHFSHTPDPKYSNLPIQVVIEFPGGDKENISFNLPFGEDAGMSECEGDVCNLTMGIKEGIKMPAGEYIITVINAHQDEYVPNVLSVGISVENGN
jgi:gliding motility-associated lipoprotein GldH